MFSVRIDQRLDQGRKVGKYWRFFVILTSLTTLSHRASWSWTISSVSFVDIEEITENLRFILLWKVFLERFLLWLWGTNANAVLSCRPGCGPVYLSYQLGKTIGLHDVNGAYCFFVWWHVELKNITNYQYFKANFPYSICCERSSFELHQTCNLDLDH